MILFDLKCDHDHVFESWFKDSATFTRHQKRGDLACPVCGSSRITKAPMAPSIVKGEDRPRRRKSRPETPQTVAMAKDPDQQKMAKLMRELGELRRQIEQNCDYVGESFPEEARKIHYGETEHRNIYGEATEDEAKELNEEGIEFSRVPWLPRHDA
jgi:hypothetical protein